MPIRLLSRDERRPDRPPALLPGTVRQHAARRQRRHTHRHSEHPTQQYFVERFGGDCVHVNVMCGPGADPHTYEPKPEQMRALSRSVAG